MNEIRAISVFIRAATLGSLRRASVDLAISPQAASQSLAQLEKTLGVRLFHRSTRKLSLTEEGQRFLDSVTPGIAILTNAIDDARRAREDVAGPLRVSAPRAFGVKVLWPHILEFARAHPEVQLDMQFDDRFTDAVSDRVDVGFRGGSPPAEGLIARLLSPIQLIVCASPVYLARHGVPESIDALAGHRCTGYRRANTGRLAPWEFQSGEDIESREIEAAVYTNDVDAETEAVVAGLCIGQLASFTSAGHIRAGRLVPLLVNTVSQREALYLYYRHRTEQPLRVRRFVDFMVTRIGASQDFFLTPAELRAAHAAALVSPGAPAHAASPKASSPGKHRDGGMKT
jgi:DNA-binding transcriptional LysR family regulator